MDSKFLEDPHPISHHLRPTSHATTSAAAAAASSQRVFRDLGRGSILCSVRISFQSANMHANHLLLEEPIRMASILEPSRANFFPAMTKIVGTLGPRSRSVEVICGCLKAGMSVARFDFSLGDPEYHQETLENLRAAVKTEDCSGLQPFDEEILHISGSFLPAHTGSVRWLDKNMEDQSHDDSTKK